MKRTRLCDVTKERQEGVKDEQSWGRAELKRKKIVMNILPKDLHL